MSRKIPEWFKIWNEKEFMPLKKDVAKLKKPYRNQKRHFCYEKYSYYEKKLVNLK